MGIKGHARLKEERWLPGGGGWGMFSCYKRITGVLGMLFYARNRCQGWVAQGEVFVGVVGWECSLGIT